MHEDKDLYELYTNFIRGAANMGDSVPIVALVDNALKGKEKGTRSNRSGCKDPIALVKSNDDEKSWFFTDSNMDVINGAEVIFGSSPAGMIAALEVYLGIDEPRLQSVKNNSWGDERNVDVKILEYPIFTFSDITDVAILMQLVDEYGAIDVRFGVGNAEYMEIRKALALGGYFIANHNSIVRKNNKQAKAFLRRLRHKPKKTTETFWVQHLYDFAHAIHSYLPGFHGFKSKAMCSEVLTDIMGLIFIFEGIHGKGSRYRLEPFRRLIQKWRSTPKKSPAFENPKVALFVQWLDREAALRDNKKSLIMRVEFDEIINGMADKKIKQGDRTP